MWLNQVKMKIAIKERIYRSALLLDDGRILSIFLNRDNNLFCADIIWPDEKGGIEFVRVHLNGIELPSDKEVESI